MTERKLLRYLQKDFEVPVDKIKITPVVLTDSKGRYLEEQCKTEFDGLIK